MIAFVDRAGPPEAMSCPVLLCDICADPIQDGRGIVAWTHGPYGDDRRPGRQTIYTVHRGRCDQALKAQVGPTLWRDADEVLAQLVHNHSHPFADDPAVTTGDAEYVAPEPSSWRVGRYTP